jgi:hypothetical protein
MSISKSITIDCSTQENVIFALHCAIRNSPREFVDQRKLQKLLIAPFENVQNLKILNFELEYNGKKGLLYDPQFVRMRQMVKSGNKIKVIIYVNLDNMYTCKHMTTVLHSLKLIQLPVGAQNLGLVFIHHVAYVLDYDWTVCFRDSYNLLNCPKYGCHILKTLIQQNATGDFTNVHRVRYDDEDDDLVVKKLPRYEEFVKKNLDFLQVRDQDVNFYQSHVFQHLRNVYLHYYGLEYDDKRHNLDVWLSFFSKIKSTAEWREADYQYHYADNRKNSHFELDKTTNEYKTYADERFEQFAKVWRYARLFSNLDYDEVLYNFMLVKLSERADKPSIRIRRALLELAAKREAVAEELKFNAICPMACNAQVSAKFDIIKTCEEGSSNVTYTDSQLAMIQTYKSNRKILALIYWYRVHNSLQTIKRMYQTAINSNVTQPKDDYTYTIFSSLIFEKVEAMFNHTTAELAFRQSSQEDLVNTVDRFLQNTTEWIDEYPNVTNNSKLWELVDEWLAIKQQSISSEYFYELVLMLGYILPTRMFKLHFAEQMSTLVTAFGEKLLNTAIQQLAASKMRHVDAAVVLLDRDFLAMVTQLHSSMDRDQWLGHRPQLFYALLRFQEKRQNFDDFLRSVQLLFGINYVIMPLAPKRELIGIQAEFWAYEKRLEKYTKRPLDTVQNWARRMEITREFIFKNSATTRPSLINEGVAWMRSRIGCLDGSRMDHGIGPTLLLFYVLVKKFWKKF